MVSTILIPKLKKCGGILQRDFHFFPSEEKELKKERSPIQLGPLSFKLQKSYTLLERAKWYPGIPRTSYPLPNFSGIRLDHLLHLPIKLLRHFLLYRYKLRELINCYYFSHGIPPFDLQFSS